MMVSLLVLRTAFRRSLGCTYSYCQLKTETGHRRRFQAINTS